MKLLSSFIAITVTAFSVTAQNIDIWTGSVDGNWSTPGNWSGVNTPPHAFDSLVFGSSAQTSITNDLATGAYYDGLVFQGGASAFTAYGNGLVLSGNYSGINFGITNTSGGLEDFELAVTNDWGYYTFSSPVGGSIALNGGLALNPGSVAFFDNNVTSTTLTADGTTGLISGLENAGLMFGSLYGVSAPTNLATISGGAIVPYTTFTGIASGAIGSGNNLKLTASGSSTIYTCNSSSTVNTITVQQAGNINGSATTTLTNTSSTAMVLGSQGGIYVLNSATGAKSVFSMVGGPITAGTTGPGTLVFAANGNNASNEVTIGSAIVNNAGGGAVSVVTTGPGSLLIGTSSSNNYTGGTWITQGQVQCGKTNGLGFAPAYIAAGASLYFQNAGIYPIEEYLSPGYGAPLACAVPNGGALLYNVTATGVTNTATVHLQGAPVTTGPGDRICVNNGSSATIVFTGQITGTGTLDLYPAVSAIFIELRNQTANSNNFQGGIILEPKAAAAAHLRMGANNQIPSGANAGNLTIISAGSVGTQVQFDCNGHNATINGLIGPNSGSSSTNQQVGNFQGGAASTLTLGANDASGTFYGVVYDQGGAKTLSLVKIGAGTETFAGSSANNSAGTSALTYNGSTTVSNGTLQLANSASIANSPTITVAAGATLDGSLLTAGGITISPSQTLVGLGEVNGNTTINGTVNPTLTTIGQITNNGSLTINGGSTYVWDINNTTGNAGADPGWGLLNVSGSVAINASISSQITIKLTSLTTGDVPGNAANFSTASNGTWLIVQTPSPITGFDPSFFHVDTSSFSNSIGSGAFAVSTNASGIILTFVGVPVISSQLSNVSAIHGATAVFTVAAAGAVPPVSYQWQLGSSVLSDGSQPSGSTITGSSTASLTIADVQDADGGAYTVQVTDDGGRLSYSSAELTVVDPPGNISVTPPPQPLMSASGVAVFTAANTGTAPFNYIWYLNGTQLSNGGDIQGANTASLTILDVSEADAGSYSVVVSNSAGSATSSVSSISIIQVPNQMVYESFDSYAQIPWPGSLPSGGDSWEHVTNIYNQITGEPVYWYHSSGNSTPRMTVEAQSMSTRNGGTYPWFGLAADAGGGGYSTNELYYTSSLNNHMHYTSHAASPGSKVYVSFIWNGDQGGSLTASSDVFLGLGGLATDITMELGVLVTSPGSAYQLGIFKGSGTSVNAGSTNGAWVPQNYLLGENIFIVACYTVNSGGSSTNDDTVALWINPDASTFYAAETNVPAATVPASSYGMANGPINELILHNTASVSSRRIADLRIGSTWASVTPPSGPALSLANVSANLGTTAVLQSENAGNPVVTYQWQFNNGAPLSDGGNITGSSTAALTIANVQCADMGPYTVTGQNTDLFGTNWTGSASAMLLPLAPALQLVNNNNQLVLSWPTNASCFNLESAASFDITPVVWSPYTGTITVNGTNNQTIVSSTNAAQYFELSYP